MVDAIYRFPTHMVFFTTPELLEIGGLPLTTPYEKPTRLEALRYYRKVVDTYQLQVALHEEVTAVTRSATATIASSKWRRAAGAGNAASARLAPSSWRWATTGTRTCSVSRRGPAARHPLLRRGAPVLPPAGGRRRRQELRLRSGARTASRRRACDARASRRDVGRLGEVLGAPRHREPHQGGLIAARFSTEVLAIRPTEVVVRRAGEPKRTHSGRGRVAADRLPGDPGFLRGRRGARPRAASAAPRRHLRDERAEPVHRRWAAGRPAHRHHLHRERPFSRRADARVLAERLHATPEAARPGHISLALPLAALSAASRDSSSCPCLTGSTPWSSRTGDSRRCGLAFTCWAPPS